ncbi:preQ(1) synthase [Methanobrevibacter sp.]
MERNSKNIQNIGKYSEREYKHNKDVLEVFETEHNRSYMINWDCFEFTSICPVTKRAEFGKIKISYIPNELCLEGTSLKLYLASFRNVRIFYEDIVYVILNDLIEILNPKYIEVMASCNPSEGISVSPYANYGLKNTSYEDFAFEKLKNQGIS